MRNVCFRSVRECWIMLETATRLLRLLSLLQTRNDWTGPQLAERLEVSTRTIRNDIDRLRRLGYPIDAAPGVAGGYRLGAGSSLPPLLLVDDVVAGGFDAIHHRVPRERPRAREDLDRVAARHELARELAHVGLEPARQRQIEVGEEQHPHRGIPAWARPAARARGVRATPNESAHHPKAAPRGPPQQPRDRRTERCRCSLPRETRPRRTGPPRTPRNPGPRGRAAAGIPCCPGSRANNRARPHAWPARGP